MSCAANGDNLQKGYVHLYRSIFEDEHYPLNENRSFTKHEAKLDLILLARGTDTVRNIDGDPVQVKRGSYWTAQRFLAKRWRWSKTKVRNFLDYLESDRFLTQDRFQKGTLITIVNYNDYNKLNGSAPRKKTAGRPQRNRNETKYNEGKKESKNVAGKPALGDSLPEDEPSPSIWQQKVGPIIDYLTERFGESKNLGGIAGRLMNLFDDLGSTGEEVVWILANHAEKPESPENLLAYVQSFDPDSKLELLRNARYQHSPVD